MSKLTFTADCWPEHSQKLVQKLVLKAPSVVLDNHHTSKVFHLTKMYTLNTIFMREPENGADRDIPFAVLPLKPRAYVIFVYIKFLNIGDMCQVKGLLL